MRTTEYKLNRRQFLATTAAAVTAPWLSRPTRAAESAKKPNIIFILADDLGYGDLGCYGQKRIQTPNIDRLAAEGLRFTDAYAGSTVCAPSRCVLMTGLHTGHTIIRGNANVPLRPEDTTVAQLLKSAGYSTALIGKWGCGEAGSVGVPNAQGFDYFFGYLNQVHAHNYYTDFLWRNDQKVPLPNQVTRKPGRELGGVSTNKKVYSHDLFASEALEFVESHKEGPFFLYLALTIPHANNEAGGKGMEVPDLGPYKDKPWPEPQKGHAAMITRMDGDIGRLMEKLKTLGIDDNTIVFFTSDNGPHKEGGNDPEFNNSSGPLKGYKRALYEGGIRVPFIARWPGKIAAGTQTDLITAFWDFLPTACDLAGTETPAGLDGLSMAPTLLGKPESQKKHEYMYWEFHEQGKRQAVRMGNYKAIKQNIAKNPDSPIELYDLSQDIGETKDIAAEHPDIVKKAAKLFKSARTPNPHWPWPGDPKNSSPKP